jgi:hypothetical protein
MLEACGKFAEKLRYNIVMIVQKNRRSEQNPNTLWESINFLAVFHTIFTQSFWGTTALLSRKFYHFCTTPIVATNYINNKRRI